MFDSEKFQLIVEKYRKPLILYCINKFGRDTSFAEETVNDVFRVVYEKWDTLDTDRDMQALLYEITRRCIKHNYAEYQKYYIHNESLEDGVEQGQYGNAVWFDEYFSDDRENDIEAQIQRIKAALPENYQPIFHYRFIEKKTITEISELLDIPYSSLRYHLIKIDKLIRNEIKKIFY